MKKTNDLYGHDMGDSAIKEIASIILKVISKEDIAIRYGYYRYQADIMIVTVVLLVVLVQLFQTIGMKLSVRLDKRK